MIVLKGHSTFIPGALKFAEWADNLKHVQKVVPAHIRTLKIKHGTRPPVFRVKKNSVENFFYADGAMQVMYIFAVHPMTSERLCRYLVNEYAESLMHHGCGESSKDPVILPPYIERQLAAATRTGRQASSSAVATQEPEVESMTIKTAVVQQVEPLVLSAKLAQAYRFLLGLDPSGKSDSFAIEGITGRLSGHYKGQSSTWLYTALVGKGLIIPGERVKTGFAAVKRSTVVRREVMVSDHPPKTRTPVAKTSSSPAVKKLAIQSTAKRLKAKPHAKAVSEGPLEHYEFYRHHADVLNEWNRRSRDLAKRGYAIREVDGQPGLVKIKK